MMPRRGMVRLLLLAAVVVGVAGMHTLGHPGSGHAPMKPMPRATAHGVGMPPAPDMEPAVALRPDLRMPVLTPLTSGLDPTAACMAIITGFGAFLLGAMMLRTGRRRPGDHQAEPQWATAVGRAPPRSVLVGLQLTDLSVARI